MSAGQPLVERYAALRRDAEAMGLAARGGFHPESEDGVPAFPDGAAAATVVIFGFVGGLQWRAFSASAERGDGAPDALDRWSRRVIDELGRRHHGVGLYPNGGPPWLPFQRWAMRAESVHRSPLGVLIHPLYGLWHSYRGALAFQERIDLPAGEPRPNPCDACAAKPCLATCPVGAVTRAGYDAPGCRHHVAAAAGRDCLELGCGARRSCPIGAAYRYSPEQAEFHMRAFIGRR